MRTIRRGLGVAVLAVLAVATVGAGPAWAPVQVGVQGLGPAELWVGLKSSDDQATSFDIKVELFQVPGTPSPVGTIIARCVTGVTRNPSLATEVSSAFNSVSFPGLAVGVFGVKVSTRIGTNSDDTKCGTGHNSATGLRLYYDAADRASSFHYLFIGGDQTAYLRSGGNPCANAPSTNVTNPTLDGAGPLPVPAKCKDSGAVNFAGGNQWKEIGTWTGVLPAT